MESCKDVEELDVFQGPASQDLGEEREEGVVYHVTLRRIRYGGQSTDNSPTSQLLWNSEKVRSIRAGSLEKLVEGLAPHPRIMEVSHAYRTCFLSTYRCFSDTGAVVGLLVSRYLSMVEKTTDSFEEWQDKRSIEKGILSFFGLWLDKYPQDFPCPLSNPHLISLYPLMKQCNNLNKAVMAMQEESRNVCSNGHSGGDLSEDSSEGGEALSKGGEDERDITAVSPLFSMSPEEFSHALTSEDATCCNFFYLELLLDHLSFHHCTSRKLHSSLTNMLYGGPSQINRSRLFLGMSSQQCLEYIRRPKDTTNAPTVRACIEHFNKVSLVVIASILKGLTPDQRSLTIERWLTVAQYCRGVKNFSSLKAIVSGLLSTPVFRLQRSWDLLSHSKLQLFHELSDLLSADDNYQISRNLLNREGTAKYAEVQTKRGWSWKVDKPQSPVGVVPYLGTFLTDLTMLHTAYKDKTEDGLINFQKFRKLFDILVQLTLFQKSATNYCFHANTHLLHWLQSMHFSSPSDSHALSEQLEPDTPISTTTRNSMLKVTQAKALIPTSSTYFHRSLLHMFGIKDSSMSDETMGDSSLTSAGHASNTIGASISEHDFTRMNFESSSKRCRSTSHSPIHWKTSMPIRINPGMREGVGHIVRVAVENDISCLYKSLMVEQSDKCHIIIQQSMEKHGFSGSHKQFKLFQVKGDKNQHIPSNANIYYALDTSEKALPITLLLSPNT